jgi:hypothetical protein
MQVLGWEAGALFWNCLRCHGGEKTALEKMRATPRCGLGH